MPSAESPGAATQKVQRRDETQGSPRPKKNVGGRPTKLRELNQKASLHLKVGLGIVTKDQQIADVSEKEAAYHQKKEKTENHSGGSLRRK